MGISQKLQGNCTVTDKELNCFWHKDEEHRKLFAEMLLEIYKQKPELKKEADKINGMSNDLRTQQWMLDIEKAYRPHLSETEKYRPISREWDRVFPLTFLKAMEKAKSKKEMKEIGEIIGKYIAAVAYYSDKVVLDCSRTAEEVKDEAALNRAGLMQTKDGRLRKAPSPDEYDR